MKNIRRFLAILMAMMMLMSTSAFALSEPGVLPLSDETITLTVGYPQSAVIEDIETAGQTLRLEKDLNVNLEFVELPTGNEFTQKVELMMMSGGDELPDIIMGDFALENLVKYGEMGMIIPVNEYYETMAYYTNETLTANGLDINDMLPYVTCYDGNIYGLFRFHGFLNNSLSGGRMLVYKPWLDKLGMEMPQTTEEFAEMLRRFVKEDPNGNGVADEIGLMGCTNYLKTNFTQFLMNPFIYTQDNYFLPLSETTDGKIGFSANKPEWKEGLKWIKSLIDEGLISPLTFTQDNAQLTAVMNPEPEVVGCVARISATNLGATDVRRGEYTAMIPLQGPAGQRNHPWKEQVPGVKMVITANCENPEAAFRLGDYMCSEVMSIWNRYGEEGKDWVRAGENAIGTMEKLGYEPFMEVLSTWGVLQNSWWAQIGPYILTDKVTCGQSVTPDTLAYNAAYWMAQNMGGELEYNEPSVVGLVYNEEESEVIIEYQSTINTYVAQSFAEFVTGVRDIDAEWDKYVAEFDKMGLEPYMDAVNSCYARMYGAE